MNEVDDEFKVHVEYIDVLSPHLGEVKALWRANSATLGFFPDGAFADYARRRQILVALDPKDRCVGYVLYYSPLRPAFRDATIMHLCVDKIYRRRGVATVLINHLKNRTKHCGGIRLRCCRDYAANALWPKLGFTAEDEILGSSGRVLTEWRFDHGHPSLLTGIMKKKIQSKLVAVLDACVFYDLQDDPKPGSEESKSLLADWLQIDVELCVTAEMVNEIDRSEDPEQRDKSRQYVKRFTRLPTGANRVETAKSFLHPHFPVDLSLSDESDIRQLAHAIAGDAHFFLTYDSGLFAIEDAVYEKSGVSIIRPSEFITRLDELTRESQYQPARLSGSQISTRRVKAPEIPVLVEAFQHSEARETKGGFRKLLGRFLANPYRFETSTLFDVEQNPLALVVLERESPQHLGIPIFRVARGSLSSTLAVHVLSRCVSIAARERRPLLRIEDPYLSNDVLNALQENAFVPLDSSWIRIGFAAVETAGQLASKLGDLIPKFGETYDYLEELCGKLKKASSTDDEESLLELERALWPAKMTDIDVPSFIVPIKPFWASELFEENLAAQTLFGADPGLMLRAENVYYRAKHPGGLEAPGRILWYVSESTDTPGSKHLRACSYLDEVVYGMPRDLFRRFRRLGVFQWKDVLRIADNNPENEIMAFRFSGTEVFSSPVHWQDIQETLKTTEGRGSQLQSPLRISKACFAHLYNQGAGMQPGRPNNA